MLTRKEHRSLAPDIVPMAGVALLIVLMMMMTATQLLTHENVPVNVPVTTTMERKTEENLTIALREDELGEKEFYLNDSLMPLPAIERLVGNQVLEDSYFLIVIRADRDVPSQWVMDLLSMAREAGAQRIAISTKRKHEKPSEEATEGT